MRQPTTTVAAAAGWILLQAILTGCLAPPKQQPSSEAAPSFVAAVNAIATTDTKPPASQPSPPPKAPLPIGFRESVDRHGITWTFGHPARCGRYINGDWWVLGPITINSIKPASIQNKGRVMHGSMQNPSPRLRTQGYDNAVFDNGRIGKYEQRANAAFNITHSNPLSLEPSTSLVSTTSHPIAGELPQIENCAVLTCVEEEPDADAFRPPYCGTDKRSRWRLADIDLTMFAQLDPVAGSPKVNELIARFERTWLDHLPGLTGRFIHPRHNMPNYGRDLAELVGIGALTLQLNVPLADKRQLAIAMIQLGIDTYGVIQNGGHFRASDGSGSGRKFPLLLAGAVLHDADLLRCASENKFLFGEDAQTFFVSQTSDSEWNHGHGGYGKEDEGLPEWGNRHAYDSSSDRKAWTADPYRRCCTANVWHGYVLASRIMGLAELWDHPALFAYVDRYMLIETKGHWMRSGDRFSERMWDRYRRDF